MHVDIAEVLRDSISTLWSSAAVHRNGCGLDSGWDHTVYQQLKRKWRRDERHALLGTLEIGMAAGFWPSRHLEAGDVTGAHTVDLKTRMTITCYGVVQS